MTTSKRWRIRPLISTVALLGMYRINASIGQAMDNLSLVYTFPQLPPGYTFAVARGSIYLLLIARLWSVRTIADRDAEKLRTIHGLFRVSCLANSGRVIATVSDQFRVSCAALVVLFWSLRLLFAQQKTFYTASLHRQALLIPIGLYLGRVLVATWLLVPSQAMHVVHGIGGSSHPVRLVSLFMLTACIACVARARFHHRSVLVLVVRGLGTIVVKNRFVAPGVAALGLGAAMLVSGYLVRKHIPTNKTHTGFLTFFLLLLVFLGLSLLSKNRFRMSFQNMYDTPVVTTTTSR